MKKFTTNIKNRHKFLTDGAQFIRYVTADIKERVFPQNVFENPIALNQRILKNNLAVVIGQTVIGDDIALNKFFDKIILCDFGQMRF